MNEEQQCAAARRMVSAEPYFEHHIAEAYLAGTRAERLMVYAGFPDLFMKYDQSKAVEVVGTPVNNIVTMYADGACSGNPGPGGWGVSIEYAGMAEQSLCGGSKYTTNNQMELQAAIEGLKALKWPSVVTIYVDSEYVRKGITEWVKGWKARGWKTASGTPVKNMEQWKELDSIVSNTEHQLTWKWVKGHSGNLGNTRADELANLGMNGLTKRKSK